MTPGRIRGRKKVTPMSKYTTEVRYICEMRSGFPVDEMADHTPDEIIEAARTHIFDFDYPIYAETHKPELETKILKHYYTREIGAETVGLWKLWLNEKLNLIMPKYNRLYAAEAETLEKELHNIDVTTETTREDDFERRSDFTRTDNLTDTPNLTRTTKDKYSDTPQGTVTNVDNNSYLTDYRDVTDTETGTTTHTGTQRNAGAENNEGTQEITSHEYGYRGGKLYYELMSEYAEKVLNIDLMIVDELSDLFMKLW